MASHTGQKWSRFFYLSWNFLFKSTFLFQVEMFQFKSKSFFFKLRCSYSSRHFLMSRIYFFMSRFLFQVEVFISCREFFHFDIFLFKRRFLFSSRSFKWTFLNSWRVVTQEYLLAFPGNDISNKIRWRLVF